jgi:two-component system, NtrC family, sensor kinase
MREKLYLLVVLIISNLTLLSQVSVLDSLNSVYYDVTTDSHKIDELNELIFQFAPSNPEKVLAYCDTCIHLSISLNDSLRLAHSLSRKGLVLYYLGDFNRSLDYYFNALNIKNKKEDHRELWREYNNIGLVLRALGQNDEALNYFNRALGVLKADESPLIEATILNNIGISYRGLKQYNMAKEAVEKALETNIGMGASQAMAHNFNNLGNILFFQQNYPQARENFLKALAINRELNNQYEEALVHSNLAELYINKQNFPQALVNLTSGDSIANHISAIYLKIRILGLFASYHEKINNYETANGYLKRYSHLTDSIYTAIRLKQFDQLKTLAEAEKNFQRMMLLEEISTIQQERIRFQKIIQFIGAAVILIILVLLIVLHVNLRWRKKLNKSLLERSLEVEALNHELMLSNEEISTQRDELSNTLLRLQNTQKQLIQSEKMASLGVLSAGVAHEINNPLNYINGGYIGLKQFFDDQKEVSDPVVPELLNSIQEGVKRVSRIVAALGQFNRKNESLLESCDIHKIIDNSLIMMNYQLKNRIEIVRSYTKESVVITGNVGKLHQVFVNIISNAIDAIQERGRILITTQSENEQVKVLISDTGTGINEADLPRIMDIFYTTKDPGKGTGLGLPIAYEIMKEHNGTIDFESIPNSGATVILTFPVRNQL